MYYKRTDVNARKPKTLSWKNKISKRLAKVCVVSKTHETTAFSESGDIAMNLKWYYFRNFC